MHKDYIDFIRRVEQVCEILNQSRKDWENKKMQLFKKMISTSEKMDYYNRLPSIIYISEDISSEIENAMLFFSPTKRSSAIDKGRIIFSWEPPISEMLTHVFKNQIN